MLRSVQFSRSRCSACLMLGLAIFANGLFLNSAPSEAAESINSLLKQIRQVESFGQGNEAASAAWKQLSQANAEQLPQILAGMDGADALATNWIRAAVDTIAARQLKSGGKLPEQALEAFVQDTSHGPRGRALAFLWIQRVDEQQAQALIPGFLHDPSVELRRLAVARLVTAGEKLESDKASKEQLEVHYAEAFSGARDEDQIQLLAKKLSGLGHKVNLPRHFGFVMDWKLIGPFDNTDKSGFDVAYTPEKQLDFDAKYEGKKGEVAWIDHATEDDYGIVDLNKALTKHMGAVGYAAADFYSEKATPAQLRLTTKNAFKLFLNGELVAAREIYHAGTKLDQYVFDCQLQAGHNQLVLKCLQNEQTDNWAQGWQFQLRVCDSAGTAILSTKRPE